MTHFRAKDTSGEHVETISVTARQVVDKHNNISGVGTSVKGTSGKGTSVLFILFYNVYFTAMSAITRQFGTCAECRRHASINPLTL